MSTDLSIYDVIILHPARPFHLPSPFRKVNNLFNVI